MLIIGKQFEMCNFRTANEINALCNEQRSKVNAITVGVNGPIFMEIAQRKARNDAVVES